MNARVRGRTVKVDKTRVRGGVDALRCKDVAVGATQAGGQSRLAHPAPAPILDDAAVRFTIPGPPMGYVRQIRSDRWNPRDCTLRYREWSDHVRASANRRRWPKQLQGRILVVSYLQIPPSYSAQQQATLPGLPHQVKPDADNIVKGILDALFENDSFIYDERCVKLYDDGQGPRSEVSLA